MSLSTQIPLKSFRLSETPVHTAQSLSTLATVANVAFVPRRLIDKRSYAKLVWVAFPVRNSNATISIRDYGYRFQPSSALRTPRPRPICRACLLRTPRASLIGSALPRPQHPEGRGQTECGPARLGEKNFNWAVAELKSSRFLHQHHTHTHLYTETNKIFWKYCLIESL